MNDEKHKHRIQNKGKCWQWHSEICKGEMSCNSSEPPLSIILGVLTAILRRAGDEASNFLLMGAEHLHRVLFIQACREMKNPGMTAIEN